MKDMTLKAAVLCSVLLMPTWLLAQSDTDTDTETSVSDEDTAGLMTPEELQTLVGPVALYPDTLLIQVLVAATYPLEIVKADRLVSDNPDTAPEDLKPEIDEQGWDESVAMLATAFPDVLNLMAVHIDWTETIGNAMLAQSDDVMAATQVMREKADEAGTLVSGDEQTVEITQEDNGDQTIIIQPADPEIVYVPQYNTNTVYVYEDNNTGDAIAAGLIAFGTFVILDEIFNDDDPWNNYWGCRNCGGWNGRPIYNNPGDIDIDIDTGDINIGNNVNIGNGSGWKPDERRKREARDDISRRRGADGTTKLPISRPDRGDQLRANLSRNTGARDISRDKSPRTAIDRSRPSSDRKGAVARTGAAPSGARKASSRPKAARAAPSRKPKTSTGGGMKRRSSAPKAQTGASRGRASSGRKRRK